MDFGLNNTPDKMQAYNSPVNIISVFEIILTLFQRFSSYSSAVDLTDYLSDKRFVHCIVFN